MHLEHGFCALHFVFRSLHVLQALDTFSRLRELGPGLGCRIDPDERGSNGRIVRSCDISIQRNKKN